MSLKGFKILNIILSIIMFIFIFCPVCKSEYETVYGYKAIFGVGINKDVSILGVFLFIGLIYLIIISLFKFWYDKVSTTNWNILFIIVNIFCSIVYLLFNTTKVLTGNDYPEAWVMNFDITIWCVIAFIIGILNAVITLIYIIKEKR